MADDAERRFDELWREHAAAVLRYAYRRVPSGDVDDVVAETFVVAWRRLDELPGRPLPWLLGVARGVSANVARASLRRDALHRQVGSRRPPGVVPDVADALTDGLPDPAHLLALQRLPAVDQELLTLLAWDDLSHEEAAEVLGCSRGALRVRLHRARRRFRALLAEPGATPQPPSPAAPPRVPVPTTAPTTTSPTTPTTWPERTGGAA